MHEFLIDNIYVIFDTPVSSPDSRHSYGHQLLSKICSSFRKFYGRQHDLVERYGISASLMTTDMFHLS